MSKFIVIFSRDWADEFQCESYTLYNSKKAAEQVVAAYIKDGGYFGTNEGFEEDELSEFDFEIKEIPDVLAEQLTDLLGVSFGTGLS